ncbi:hypothetical protein GBAR_LOCUS19125 [Geodia barretti]|uniref:Uncharacterized protein n=1 Tax=Geodia barretti TaxID=519541 RepID=A0AA35SS49_GEOBA|nr:hypothetical protein GBAR_LOCUS19125 [Geodia barretti]
MLFGAITAFFSVLFLSSLGMLLYYNDTSSESDKQQLYDNVESLLVCSRVVGAFMAILVWISSHDAWFFTMWTVTFRRPRVAVSSNQMNTLGFNSHLYHSYITSIMNY